MPYIHIIVLYEIFVILVTLYFIIKLHFKNNRISKEEDFIVMGRCADVILANNHIPHISIFITAPFEQRVRRIMEVNDLDHKKAVRLLKKLDHQHARYYNYYTGQKWGDAMNYDICFNSASYGIEESVDIIERMLNQNTNS